MKLNKEQKNFIKRWAISGTLYIVLFPLGLLLAGKPMSWSLFLIFACIGIAIYALLGYLGVVIGHSSMNDDK